MSDGAQTGTIKTRIPARLDRLPWARFHWRIIIGLGTAWILDGLEVNVVSSVSSRVAEHGSGVNIAAHNISGLTASLYIAGACFGALLFGQLTDRLGRKRLFMITLSIYLAGTFITAFAFAPIWLYIFRFVTGMGIGGEYSAINSAIDELIPARHRGRVDIAVNGSYWVGGIGGPLLAIVALNESIFPAWLGWRLAFGVGVVIGVVVLFIRRKVPESPRWLFIHGRDEEAERIVRDIEQEVSDQTGERLEEVGEDKDMVVRQRRSIGVLEVMRTVAILYPKRTILGLSLFVGQAFLYNSILFGFGQLLTQYFHTSSGDVPYYIAAYGAGNLIGPLVLGPLFDTVGRKPMIAGTYLLSGVLLIITGLMFQGHVFNATTFTLAASVVFFFASAGVSAAYLTVSEVFPMETRALCIAVFYAVGTGIGGIIGPLVFSHLINSGSFHQVFLGLTLGAVLMIIGGLAELVFGVKAEQTSLEDIAKPLTVEDAEREGRSSGRPGSASGPPRSRPATV